MGRRTCSLVCLPVVDGDRRIDVTCQPIILSEFGGIAYSPCDGGTWGYSRSNTPQDLLARYRALLDVVRSLPSLAGFCYTQFADTYQEANGLLFANREPKLAFEEIALATSGREPGSDAVEDLRWRELLMKNQR
jgi:hypothetical protein